MKIQKTTLYFIGMLCGILCAMVAGILPFLQMVGIVSLVDMVGVGFFFMLTSFAIFVPSTLFYFDSLPGGL